MRHFEVSKIANRTWENSVTNFEGSLGIQHIGPRNCTSLRGVQMWSQSDRGDKQMLKLKMRGPGRTRTEINTSRRGDRFAIGPRFKQGIPSRGRGRHRTEKTRHLEGSGSRNWAEKTRHLRRVHGRNRASETRHSQGSRSHLGLRKHITPRGPGRDRIQKTCHFEGPRSPSD